MVHRIYFSLKYCSFLQFPKFWNIVKKIINTRDSTKIIMIEFGFTICYASKFGFFLDWKLLCFCKLKFGKYTTTLSTTKASVLVLKFSFCELISKLILLLSIFFLTPAAPFKIYWKAYIRFEIKLTCELESSRALQVM